MTPRSFEMLCPGCGRQHPAYDAAHTVLYVCGSCHIILRQDGTGVFKPAGNMKPATIAPVLPLGMEGSLEGRPYRVICYAQRREEGSQILWQEYTLLDTETGEHRFLSEYQGHWQLIRPIPATGLDEAELSNQRNTDYEGQQYQLYNKYTAAYVHAQGEFFWDAHKDKFIKCREYIHPPQMLIQEKSTSSTDYFLASYVDPRKITAGFHPASTPAQVGTGPLQPFYWNLDVGRFVKGAVIFCLLMIVLQYVLNMSKLERLVLNETFAVTDSTVGKPIVLPSFTLTGGTSNLQIDAYARIENSWVEAEVSLVNEKNGEETSFATGVEYYSGVTDGESWSEGSWSKSELLCAVEPGTYHFVVTPAKEAFPAHVDMGLQATWDVPTWWNAIWACVIMALIAGGLFLLEQSFEKNRWYNSDYSPYEYDN